VCRANDGIEPKVLYSTGEEIFGEHIGKQLRAFGVIKNETRIESIDFDPKEMMVYWADSEEKAIKRSFIPGSPVHQEAQIGHPQEVLTANAKITAIAHDFLVGNIYWAEIDKWTGIASSPRGVISVAKNDGRYKREIVTGQLVSSNMIKSFFSFFTFQNIFKLFSSVFILPVLKCNLKENTLKQKFTDILTIAIIHTV